MNTFNHSGQFSEDPGKQMCFCCSQVIFSPERVFLTNWQGFGYLFSEGRADTAQLEQCYTTEGV